MYESTVRQNYLFNSANDRAYHVFFFLIILESLNVSKSSIIIYNEF
jgi:hypothetical protein